MLLKKNKKEAKAYKVILIKVKRNRLFRGSLGGFDDHLNLYLEGTSQIFEYQDEEGNITGIYNGELREEIPDSMAIMPMSLIIPRVYRSQT